jgi:hypothetical protein
LVHFSSSATSRLQNVFHGINGSPSPLNFNGGKKGINQRWGDRSNKESRDRSLPRHVFRVAESRLSRSCLFGIVRLAPSSAPHRLWRPTSLNYQLLDQVRDTFLYIFNYFLLLLLHLIRLILPQTCLQDHNVFFYAQNSNPLSLHLTYTPTLTAY